MLYSGYQHGLIYCFMGLLLACQERKPSTTENLGPQDSVSQLTDQPATTKTIVFFGNSLTAGYGLDEDQSFPALIQKKLDSLAWPYTVVNAGLSGETSAGGNSRIDWVLNQDMHVFVLELGANDALRGLDVQATQENLRSILHKVRSRHPDIPVVIAGMLAPPNLGPAYTKAFKENYVVLAAEFKAGLVPFLLERVAADPALNQADGIHPTAEGAKLVAENVWSVLKDYL